MKLNYRRRSELILVSNSSFNSKECLPARLFLISDLSTLPSTNRRTSNQIPISTPKVLSHNHLRIFHHPSYIPSTNICYLNSHGVQFYAPHIAKQHTSTSKHTSKINYIPTSHSLLSCRRLGGSSVYYSNCFYSESWRHSKD